MWFEDESGAGTGTGNADYNRILATFDERLSRIKGYLRTDRPRLRAPASWRTNTLSQHIYGTAADFQVRPDQVAAFTIMARRAGLIPVNELTRPKGSRDWTGPHMHVQMFPAGATRSVATIPRRPLNVQISEVP